MNPGEIVEPGGHPSTAPDAPRARFQGLWRRRLLPGSTDHSDAVWEAMEAKYAEPHRHYHDEGHLAHCFGQLELVRDQVACPDAVEMALWFHDVINEPGHTDNETRSADFFRDWARGVMEDGFIAAVVELILATTHRVPSEDRDQQFICDIDLTSFGCPWECYKRDTDNLKAEFPGSDEDYYRGKRAFLGAMLNKPRIFQTDFFHDRYEDQARDNIRRLLELFDQRKA
jgi:predicted metal-dependent HD superfamily phosphohydrolase